MELNKHNKWYDFEEGKTVGEKGSENGITIIDLENEEGARISLEKDARFSENSKPIPFAITFGIYGLMFHTNYECDYQTAIDYVNKTKNTIENVFALYDITENNRDENWTIKHNELMDKLVEPTAKSTIIQEEKPAANSSQPQWLLRTFRNLFAKLK